MFTRIVLLPMTVLIACAISRSESAAAATPDSATSTGYRNAGRTELERAGTRGSGALRIGTGKPEDLPTRQAAGITGVMTKSGWGWLPRRGPRFGRMDVAWELKATSRGVPETVIGVTKLRGSRFKSAYLAGDGQVVRNGSSEEGRRDVAAFDQTHDLRVARISLTKSHRSTVAPPQSSTETVDLKTGEITHSSSETATAWKLAKAKATGPRSQHEEGDEATAFSRLATAVRDGTRREPQLTRFREALIRAFPSEGREFEARDPETGKMLKVTLDRPWAGGYGVGIFGADNDNPLGITFSFANVVDSKLVDGAASVDGRTVSITTKMGLGFGAGATRLTLHFDESGKRLVSIAISQRYLPFGQKCWNGQRSCSAEAVMASGLR